MSRPPTLLTPNNLHMNLCFLRLYSKRTMTCKMFTTICTSMSFIYLTSFPTPFFSLAYQLFLAIFVPQLTALIPSLSQSLPGSELSPSLSVTHSLTKLFSPDLTIYARASGSLFISHLWIHTVVLFRTV